MSNRVSIIATKFENIHSEPPDVTYGFRMFDDEGQMYHNTDEKLPKDDLKLLKWALPKMDDMAQDMMDFVIRNKSGMYINGRWYDWTKIRPIINRWLNKVKA